MRSSNTSFLLSTLKLLYYLPLNLLQPEGTLQKIVALDSNSIGNSYNVTRVSQFANLDSLTLSGPVIWGLRPIKEPLKTDK